MSKHTFRGLQLQFIFIESRLLQMGLIERAHLVFLWSQMYFKTPLFFAMFLYPKDTVQRCTGFSNFWNSVQLYTTFEHLKRRSAKFWGSRFRQSLVHVRCNVYVAMLLPDATTSAYSAAGCSAVSAVWQALGPTIAWSAFNTCSAAGSQCR